MPTNLKMPELRACAEAAGWTDVRTVLGSGNVVFTARAASEQALGSTLERMLFQKVGRSFPVVVRRAEFLAALIESDPYAAFRLPAGAKRVVTFLRTPHRGALSLPIEREGARILVVKGAEAFSAYVPHPKGPIFMALIADTFGGDVTTRTWDTLKKCVAAAKRDD